MLCRVVKQFFFARFWHARGLWQRKTDLPKSVWAPAYPELAKKMHIGGAVKMEVDVDPKAKSTRSK